MKFEFWWKNYDWLLLVKMGLIGWGVGYMPECIFSPFSEQLHGEGGTLQAVMDP